MKRVYLISSSLILLALFSACGDKREDSSRANMETTYTSEAVVVEENIGLNQETYKQNNESKFMEVSQSPLSTFSIDVDTASYANVRRIIEEEGILPPVDAVRSEEFINYFTYKYKEPNRDEPFSINLKVDNAMWSPQHKLIQIGLQTQKPQMDNLPPSNLVFLLDVSGSMNEPNKLPLLKQSLTLLTNQLKSEDRVSIVVYAGSAGVVLEGARGDEKEKIIDSLDNLEAGGSTAGGEGIALAYEIAQNNFVKNGNNRVILATDGDFNVGASSEEELINLIEQKRASGVSLSVIGFGTGNYNDVTAETLADKGNGNYAYIDTLLEAKKVLVSQMSSTLHTVASDVKIQVEFNPSKVQSYKLVGYENRALANEDFNDDKKDAGEVGMGHSVSAIYEVILKEGINGSGVDKLKYQNNANIQTLPPTTHSNELATLKIRYKSPSNDTSKLMSKIIYADIDEINDVDSKFAQAVSAYSLLLRNSPYKGNATYKEVLELAKANKGEDDEGYRADFIKLVEKTILLTEVR